MTKFRNFPSPHVHVDSLDSASTPEAFAKREVELGTGLITVTDHGTMQACRRVYDLANGKKYKGVLTPALGIEAYFRDDRCPIFGAAGVPKTNWMDDPETGDRYWNDPELSDHPYGRKSFPKLQKEKPKIAARCVPGWGYADWFKYGHVTIHFMDEAAFKAGSIALSKADAKAEQHGSERKPIFDWAALEELGQYNITMTSGCLIGMVQRHIMEHGRFDLANQYYQKMRSIVKSGHFYTEVFPHVCDRDWDASVTLTFEDGTTQKLKPTKRIKVDKTGSGKRKDGWWVASELAEAWRKKKDELGHLREIMENREGIPVENPKKVVGIDAHEGFLQNECQPWAPGGDLQFGCNQAVIQLAERYGDRVIISDDSHFVSPDEKIVQDIRLSQKGSWRFPNAHFRFSSDNAWAYFKDVLQIPQTKFEGWIDNNYEWSSKFKGFKFSERKALPTSFYPTDTLAHTYKLIGEHGRMENTAARWDRLKAEIALLHENGTIDFLPYMFIDEEACRFYASIGKLTGPGRGSAAGLELAWLLNITHADPLRFGLSMDRFMTKDRIAQGKYPDIDQDLPTREPLDKPGGWLDRRFGECWAPISTDTKLKLRSAVKDVARWWRAKDGKAGFVPPEIEALTKKFMEAPQGVEDKKFVFGYDNDGTWVTGSIEHDEALIAYVKGYPKEWEQVQKCLGLTRSKSRHACGVVIADEPIQNFIPLTSVGGVKVTQYTAASVEAAGGLKMDFLVVNSLNDIGNCIRLIQERFPRATCDGKECWHDQASGPMCVNPAHSSPDFASAYPKDDVPLEKVPSMRINGRQVPLIRAVPFKGGYVDIWDLPEDQPVFREICEQKTETVFQFSTPGAKKWLQHFNTIRSQRGDEVHKALDSIEALAAFTALDRPGPLDAYVGEGENKHNMLVEFAHRAKGAQKVGGFPILDKLFPETYGVMVYQEQLQQAFQQVGKTTGIEANNFRIHVSKKMPFEMMEDKKIFLKGALETVGAEAAEQLWQSMETFGAYGFNKSHAVCYVIITYACAWLKHHYPLEWWTAVLRNADKREIDEEFWPHCGHLIIVPDINKSGATFQIEGDKIRAPLSIVSGIGPKAQEELEAGRPYTDLQAFIQHSKNKKETTGSDGKKGRSALHSGIVNKLICSGIMNSMFTEGSEMPQQLEEFSQAYAIVHKKKSAKPPDINFTGLNFLQRYQLKKEILTSFGCDLAPMFLDVGQEDVYKDKMGELRVRVGDKSVYLHNVANVDFCMRMSPVPPKVGIKFAVAAYVVEDERRLYHNDTKRMAKLVLDVEGRRYEFVKWPNDKGVLPAKFLDQNYKGCLILATLSRYNENRPPVIDDIILVQPKLDFKEKEES